VNVNEVNISPLARRLAEENNVDWRRLQGSGPDGRVVERDVLDYLARVMAGEEDVDPTPEPLPEGMEAWPEEAGMAPVASAAPDDDESLLVLDDKEATHRSDALTPGQLDENDEPDISEDVFLFAAEDEEQVETLATEPFAAEVPAHRDEAEAPPLFDAESDEGEAPQRDAEAHLDFEGWGSAQGDEGAIPDEAGFASDVEASDDAFSWDAANAPDDEGTASAPVFAEEPASDTLERDAPSAEVADVARADARAQAREGGSDDLAFEGLADKEGETPAAQREILEDASDAGSEGAFLDGAVADDVQAAVAGAGEADTAQDAPLALAMAAPLADSAGESSALPLVSYGTLLRRYLDLSPLFEAQRAVGRVLGDGTPVAPSVFLLRAAAKALREVPLQAGRDVALAVVTDDGVGCRPVDEAAEVRFSELVTQVEALLAEPPEGLEPASLVVADMSSFEIDEAVLNLGAPALILGRILFDSSEGRYRSTLTLSGEVPPAQGAELLARVAEMLDTPVQLVL
jgi:hypothetical protein